MNAATSSITAAATWPGFVLQTLLADRFQLKFHRESKEVPGFALVVAKNGPKFKEDADPAVEARIRGTSKVPEGQPIVLNATKTSMTELADLLSQRYGPVTDETELKSTYDFKLTWEEAGGRTLFTALSEQLGLKLVHRTDSSLY